MADIPRASERPGVAFPVPGLTARTPMSPVILTGVLNAVVMSRDAARLKPPGVPPGNACRVGGSEVEYARCLRGSLYHANPLNTITMD